MEQIAQIYAALKAVNSDQLNKAIMSGIDDMIVSIAPAMLDSKMAAEVLQFGCKLKAGEMVEPYKLADYIAYMYSGTLDDFASHINVTPEQVQQEIHSGNYWHGGTICSLVPTGSYRSHTKDNPKHREPDVANFVARGLWFGEGRAHVKDLWAAYTLTPGVNALSRLVFSRALEYELDKRGYVKKGALRIGAAVSTGYVGVSTKPTGRRKEEEAATLEPDVIEPDVMDFISERFNFGEGVMFINDAWKEYKSMQDYKTMTKKHFIKAVAYDMSLRGYETEGAVVGNRYGDAYKDVSL